MNIPSASALVVSCVAIVAQSGPAQAQEFKVSKSSIGGEGGHDYIVAEPGTGRVFVSRESHVMVVDGPTGRVIGDIPNTPGIHGVALAPAVHHGFTTNRGDSTVTMFDQKTLTPIRQIDVKVGGLDGIMYDQSINRVVLTNHSRPAGTVVAIDPDKGMITATVELEDTSPEGAVSDGKGRLYINNEGTSTIQVIDEKSMKVVASWPIAPCEGPTGIAYDRASNRIFSGCSNTSVVVDPATGKVVATLANGAGVDGLAWDAGEKLLYIPAGRDGNITVVHQESPDDYKLVATVPTMRGTKTIALDPVTHVAYLFAPEYGPAAQDESQPAGGRPRFARGPLLGTWFFAVSH